MRVRVSWHRAEDFGVDYDSQLARGGLLVRVEPPGLLQFSTVSLELVAPDATALTLDAQVVQVFPGVGVALMFSAAPELGVFAAAARL